MQHRRTPTPRAPAGAALCVAAFMAVDARAEEVRAGQAVAVAARAGEVAVAIQGGDNPVVEFHAPGVGHQSEPPIARCATPCTVHLVPGRYSLFVGATERYRAGSRVIDVAAPSSLQVESDALVERSVGLTLGILGGVALITGLALVGSFQCYGIDGPPECPGETRKLTVGLLMVTGGLAVTPVGWLLYSNSFGPDVIVDASARGLPVSAARDTRERTPIGLGFTRRF